MSYHYSIDGERIDDEPMQDAETVRAAVQMCREAIAEAKARTVCPGCGGRVKPGWTVHPGCAKAAS